jgi:hypothetical protein
VQHKKFHRKKSASILSTVNFLLGSGTGSRQLLSGVEFYESLCHPTPKPEVKKNTLRANFPQTFDYHVLKLKKDDNQNFLITLQIESSAGHLGR